MLFVHLLLGPLGTHSREQDTAWPHRSNILLNTPTSWCRSEWVNPNDPNVCSEPTAGCPLACVRSTNSGPLAMTSSIVGSASPHPHPTPWLGPHTHCSLRIFAGEAGAQCPVSHYRKLLFCRSVGGCATGSQLSLESPWAESR